MSVNLIKELTQAFGPSGFEDDILDIAAKHAPAGYTTSRDSLLNLYIQPTDADTQQLPVVLLDAHSDEIGLMVQAIRDDGCMTFTTIGGWIPATLYAQRMLIRATDGSIVTAVIDAPSSHLGGESTPDIDKMLLDIGAKNKAEVLETYKIAPGCPVVPAGDFVQQGDTIIAKAFDDRIGCAAVLETLAAVAGENLPVCTTAVLTSQEEVGLRGAKVAANRALPDMVICFEGAPADDTINPPYAVQCGIGRGPMIRMIDGSMIANPRVVKFCEEIAAKNNIPIQLAVRKRGGTNAGAFQQSQLGVPALVISVPTRHAHSPNSICNIKDYEAAVQLATAVIRALTPEVIAGF
jgi:putative aminopeptidase FrvX